MEAFYWIFKCYRRYVFHWEAYRVHIRKPHYWSPWEFPAVLFGKLNPMEKQPCPSYLVEWGKPSRMSILQVKVVCFCVFPVNCCVSWFKSSTIRAWFSQKQSIHAVTYNQLNLEKQVLKLLLLKNTSVSFIGSILGLYLSFLLQPCFQSSAKSGWEKY